jgi:hypothetical protein
MAIDIEQKLKTARKKKECDFKCLRDGGLNPYSKEDEKKIMERLKWCGGCD